MRIITFSKYDSLTAPIFNNLKILNLTNIYKYNLAISFHKIFNNKTHGSSNLVPIDQVHHHFTRLSKAKNYYQNFIRTNLGQSSYTTQGLKFWKTLPDTMKYLHLNSFKSKVKDYLLNS